MGSLSQKRIHLAVLVSAVYLILIALGVVFVFLRGLSGLQPVYLLNIGVDLFGLCMGYVLLICCIMDVQKTGSDNRYFIFLLNITVLGLFTDLVAWLVDGLPQLRTVNLIDNTLYYICMPMSAYFFWEYVRATLRVEGKITRVLDRVLQIVLAAAIVTRWLNLFTGMYFTVDEAGVYHRAAWYPLSLLYAYLTTAAAALAIWINRKKMARRQIAAMAVYVAAPLAAGIFTSFTYGLSVSYGVIMLVLLLMYCVVNINQGQEREAAAREMNMAAQIQAGMLPDVFPAFPERSEFDLYAVMDPAREVGGDFYDFFLVDDDHLCLTIADVSGKGVPAALFMMASKILLADNARMGKMPAQILRDTNEAICANNKMEMFVTVWLGILEISTGKLTAASAGHEYPVLRQPGGAFELIRDRHGLVVGGMSGVKYRDYEWQLRPGSRIFVYTDGVPEATDADKNLFGTERMLQALNEDPQAGPEQLLKNVRGAVDAFVREAEQFDDLTMLCLEYKGGSSRGDVLEIPAETENLPQVTAFAERVMEKAGASPKVRMQAGLAIEEVFVNIASYAYAPGSGSVRVSARTEEDPAQVVFVFEDSGRPYDPLAKDDPDVTLSGEERPIGGLGIYMTKKMMDEVSYEYKEGKNILTLRKRVG
ncbi:MAG: SpoIIE family protein phosphatase [Lachnospiraceae bacterium]|nr:SpoIIE family protein phosphatase [Lachnospiraceae bacterium]